MHRSENRTNIAVVFSILTFLLLGCSSISSGPKVEWTKSKNSAGKAQGLSHVSGLAADGEYIYVTIGGTVADQKEGTSGLRRVALDSGEVTSLDNGEKIPQAETGGIASDDNFVYWNAGGNILRIAKEGGKPETVASEHVGIGVDLALDKDKIYWSNHGYYSPGQPTEPSPIYCVAKAGGRTEIFVDEQHIPGNIVLDDNFVYWTTPTSLVKQAKSGGLAEIVFQATEKEGIDKLEQEGDSLYFGFRGAGESRWALKKVAKNGGEPQTLVETFSLKQFVVDDKDVYFFQEEGRSIDALCKIPKNGGVVEHLDSGYSSGAIAQGKTQVFLASLDDIFSFEKSCGCSL